MAFFFFAFLLFAVSPPFVLVRAVVFRIKWTLNIPDGAARRGFICRRRRCSGEIH